MNRRFPRTGRGRSLQLLLASAAALLLLAPVGGFAAAPAPAAPAALTADDVYFLPDGTQTIGQVRVGRILASDAVKQIWTAFPDAKKQFEQSAGQSVGGDLNNLDRLVFGSGKLDFAAPAPAATIVIIHFKNSVKVDDIEAAVKKAVPGFTPTYTFTDTKVGNYAMTEVKVTFPAFNPPPPKGQPAPPPPPMAPISVYAFTMSNDKTMVMGEAKAVQAVLTRDKKPEISDGLQTVLKQTDFDADVALAVNVKDGVATPAMQPSPIPFDKVDALSATIKIAADVDVSATATCADPKAAAAVSDGLKAQIAAARQALTATPKPPAPGTAPPKPPQELLDLLDVTPQVNGSSVTVQKTIKTPALIALTKSGYGLPGFVPPPPPDK